MRHPECHPSRGTVITGSLSKGEHEESREFVYFTYTKKAPKGKLA